MPETSITIASQSVLVRMWGSGHPLLVLHGWGSSSVAWEPVAKKLAAGGYQAFVPDLPGFGGSEPPQEPWGVDGYAAFVRDFCRAMQIESCHLIAHSFGGRIAIRLASSSGVSISTLVLCGAAGLRPGDLKSRIKRVVFYSLSKFGKAAARLPFLTGFQPAARKLLYRGAREHDYERANGVMREVFVRVVREGLSGDLPQVRIPTLLIWGDLDRPTPLRDGRRMRELIPESRLEVLRGVGHNAYRDRPEETADSILKFLQEQV